ncbi:MAG: hypothetical protein JW827_05445 [Spirochaetes bacterium]|nr:hypothetical protein [Spirochaetota bacterium]
MDRSVKSSLKYLNKIRWLTEMSDHFFSLLIFVFLWFLSFVLLDNLLHLNIFLRWVNLFSFLILISFHLKRSYVQLKEVTVINTAIQIEDHYHFQDQIISAYQLSDSLDYPLYFLENLKKRATRLVNKVHLKGFINFQKMYKSLARFMIPTVFLFSYGIIFPDNFKISLNRFAYPSYKIKQSHKIVKMDISPKGAVVLDGEGLKIDLTTYGKVTSPYIVLVNPSGGIIKENAVLEKVTNLDKTNLKYTYSHTIKNVYDNFKYYGETIQTRDNIPVRTDEYTISVVKKPYIKNLRLVFTYPSYTLLKSKVVDENGHIEAVEKSTVKIMGEANNPLKNGVLVFQSGKQTPLSIRENKFSGVIYLTKNDTYSINIKDIYNHKNDSPVKYQILVIKDNPPLVEIRRPGKDIEIGDSLSIPLEIYARDDYAVHALSLSYRINRAYVQAEPAVEKIDLDIKEDSEIKFNYTWDLNKIKLAPGDLVEYFALAWDGYKPEKEHIIASRVYYIRFPTVEDMYRQMNQEQSANVMTLKELLDEQKEMAEDTEKLIKTLESKKELSYIEKKELEKLKETQEKIYKTTKDLVSKINNISKKMDENKMFTPQAIDKINQIRDLMDKIADKNMRDVLNRLNEAVNKINLTQSKKELLASKLDQEEILKRLEKTLEMLKKMHEQQKLESLKKQTEQILEKQNELLSKTIDNKFKNKYSQDELAQQQKQIKEQMNKFKEDFDKLLEEIKKQSPDMYKPLQKTMKQLEESGVEQNMQNSQQSLSEKKWDDAIKEQKKSIEALNQLQSNLDQMTAGMKKKDMARILNSIDKAIFNLLQVSYRIEQVKRKIEQQSAVIKPVPSLEDNFDFDTDLSASHLAETIIFIERSVRYHQKTLEEETKEVIFFSQEFFKQFDNIYQALSQVREILANDKYYQAISFQENAQLNINIILKDLLTLKEEFKEQAQMQSGGNMSDALNQMANAQEKLNEMTERLKGQIGKDGTSSEMQDYLEELAFQQEMIRNSVNKFLQNYKEAEKLLGDLGQAAKEMEDIKEKLKSGKVDSELLKRQKKVLKRLLDSQKSLQVKDYSKERKSEEAKDYKVDIPPELKKEKLSQDEKKYYYHLMEKFPQEYKRLVDDYFKVLSTHEELMYNK